VAETGRVFFPRSTPLSLTRDHIRGLRLSLNTPVVATEELPIGPARAAILVHDDADGGPQVTIGIRALRAGRTALYAFEGDLREASSFAVAVDAALSFAESMGFLFDEDELGGGGAAARVRCLGLWRELLGEDGAGAVAPEPAEPGPAEELLLEELAEDGAAQAPGALSDGVALPYADTSDFASATDVFVPQFEDDPGAASGGALPGLDGGYLPFDSDADPAFAPQDADAGLDDEVSFAGILDDTDEPPASDEPDETVAELARPGAAAPGGPIVSLTKFRTRAPDPAAAPASPVGAEPPPPADAPPVPGPPQRAKALGRLRLVRRLRGGGGRKRHPILRLFGSF
jgi:hypothetical protein